ncbi:MAG: transglutaminase family protein [Patulibacter minatonensis]
MNYDIHYVIDYRYSGTVTDNLNTLRVRPATTPTQRCDEFKVRLEPEARLTRHIDYFGCEVLEFGVARPHEGLRIDVQARVATSPPAEPPEGVWQSLRADPYQLAGVEYLLPASDQPDEAAIADLVSEIRGETPLATVRNLCDVIPDRFEYRPGATYVGSTVDDLLAAGGGVCQDFAHLALVLLRAHGIAARYVSGYLFSTGASGATDVSSGLGIGSDPAPPAAGNASVEVATHAWVEALLPGGDGGGEPRWVGVDPTNRRLATEAHVKIGHGRHYTDVPPTKGVYFGAATSVLEARVTMTRLDPAAAL